MSGVPQAIERVLQLSRADHCIVLGEVESAANVRWANNTMTTNGVADSAEIAILSIKDRRVGMASASYFPEERLEALVRQSEEACEGKPPAQDYMPLIEGSGDAGGWEAAETRSDIAVFDRLAGQLATAFKDAARGDRALFGFAELITTTTYLATSTGIRRRHTQPAGRFELNGKSSDFSRSTWVGRVTADFESLDISPLVDRLDRQIGWSEKKLQLDPGRYQVLLDPSCVADMLIYYYWSSARRNADEGRSAFSKPGGGNRIGEKIALDGVNLYSDPLQPRLEVEDFLVAAGSSSELSVFDNGMDLEHTDWIQDGVLTNLITTRHWAQESQASPAPFIDNLVFESTGPEMEQMIHSTERALLVNCLWYIRMVDSQTLLLTGLTRDGVFLVENGKVRGAVNNFRFNMSPLDMLAGVAETGAAVPTLPREFGDYFMFTKMPALRVEDWNMSSVSEAT